MRIGHLFPDLLNLYGDLGNIRSLERRLQWRGIECEIENFGLNDPIRFQDLDIVVLGGGSDREQQIVCQRLQAIREDFKAYVEAGGVVLAICGGYQLLGHFYESAQAKIEGLGILDIDTVHQPQRLIGNIALKSELIEQPIIGFENHSGRTRIYTHQPLGDVLFGYGNDDTSKKEGVVYRHLIGTYCHGPLLPKNPQLADWLIQKALKQSGDDQPLIMLDDTLEHATNEEQLKRWLKD